MGYQPPLFPEQEEDVSNPSAQMFIRRYRLTWKRAQVALLKTNSRYRRQADRHRTPAPCYLLGQRVWPFTRYLPPWVCPINFPPISSARSPSLESFVPLLFVFCYSVPSVFTFISTCLGLSLGLTALCLLFPGPPLLLVSSMAIWRTR